MAVRTVYDERVQPYTPSLYMLSDPILGRYRSYPRQVRTPIPGAGFKPATLVWGEQVLNLDGTNGMKRPYPYGDYSAGVPLLGIGGYVGLGTTIEMQPATLRAGPDCLTIPAPPSCYTCPPGMALIPASVPGGRTMCATSFAAPPDLDALLATGRCPPGTSPGPMSGRRGGGLDCRPEISRPLLTVVPDASENAFERFMAIARRIWMEPQPRVEYGPSRATLMFDGGAAPTNYNALVDYAKITAVGTFVGIPVATALGAWLMHRSMAKRGAVHANRRPRRNSRRRARR